MPEAFKLDRNLVEVLSKRETDIRDHIWTLYNLVVGMNAGVVVELGAGQSTYALTVAVKETGGNIWSVDKLINAHLRGFPEGLNLLELESRYHFVEGDDIEVGMSWNMPIDFLFIDTSHQYDHTLEELNLWAKHVRTEGKIAMHDTDHKLGAAVDCIKALDEFLRQHPGCYKVRHIKGCGGLSILTKNGDHT